MKTNLLLIGIGTMLASMTISGFLIGFFLDYFFNTAPIFLFLVGLFGFIGGILRVKEILLKSTYQKEQIQQNSEKTNAKF